MNCVNESLFHFLLPHTHTHTHTHTHIHTHTQGLYKDQVCLRKEKETKQIKIIHKTRRFVGRLIGPERIMVCHVVFTHAHTHSLTHFQV